jgi:four helix bundle protein
MKKNKNFKIWNDEGTKIVTDVYKPTSDFQEEEKIGLVAQSGRCSVSIPLNIAEGYGRNSDAELKCFLNTSRGSSYDIEYQLIISHKPGFILSDQLEDLSVQLDNIQGGITNLQKKLKI